MKISNMHDLRIAKMRCRYEKELQERAMKYFINDLKSTALESLKFSLKYYAKDLAINLVKNILLQPKRR